MVVLQSKRPAEQWLPVTLAESADITIQVRQPTYEQVIRFRTAGDSAGAALVALECVIGWRDVLVIGANGEQSPLPFSRQALGQLLQEFPEGFWALVEALSPLFRGPADADKKKSASPPTAGTAASQPSTPTPSEPVSSDSATPSAAL